MSTHQNRTVTENVPQSLQAIAYIYIACSHLVDENLTNEEKQAVVTQLHHWLPVGDEEIVLTSLEKAIALYQQQPTVQQKLNKLHTMADILKKNLDSEQLSTLIYDLIRIARADGDVSTDETDFIIATARTFAVKITP